MLAEFMGAEFGERGPTSSLSPAGRQIVEAQIPGTRAYDDRPGLLVVEETPQPVFCRLEATAIAAKNGEAIADKTRDAYRQGVQPDERTLLSCEMYAASHFMPSEDSRFLMLMVAVEALIERGARPEEQARVIDELVEVLEKSSLSAERRRSLIQAVVGLKTESIGSAGKRLAATLGERTYADLSATRFFRDCYDARSALVHGNPDRPDAERVRQLVGPLEQFVRDLVLEGNQWRPPADR